VAGLGEIFKATIDLGRGGASILRRRLLGNDGRLAVKASTSRREIVSSTSLPPQIYSIPLTNGLTVAASTFS
jgi:hypothetical protein